MSEFLKFCAEIKRTVEEDEDQYILVTGDVRTGKSNTAGLAAVLTDPGFNPATHVCLNAVDHIRLSTHLPQGSSILRDESPDTSLSGNHATKQRREFTEYMAQAGYRNHRHFVVFPYPRYLSTQDKIRSTKSLHIPKKGVAQIVTWRGRDGDALDHFKALSKPFTVPSLKALRPELWQGIIDVKARNVEAAALGLNGPAFRMEVSRIAMGLKQVVRL